MDNFFDDLKNNLDNRPEPDMQESDWLAMQDKMKQEDQPKRGVAGWWWMSLLLIPLLLSNAWMFVRMEKTEALVEKLELQKDTIYQERIIYKTDTVYQLVAPANPSNPIASNEIPSSKYPIFSQNKFSNINSLLANNFLSKKSLASPISFSDKNDLAQTFLRHSYNQSTALTNNNTFTKNKNDLLTNPDNQPSSNISNIPSLNSKGLITTLDLSQLADIQEIDITFKDKKWQNRLRKIAHTMQPKSFLIGASGGFAYPTNLNLDNREGYIMGVALATDFSKNLRMWMDISYLRLRLKTSNLNNAYGIPTIPLPEPNYIFQKASADQNNFQYSLGMQYSFDVNKKWKPYIGLGYTAAIIQSYEIEYEYTDAILGGEIIFPKEINNQATIQNLWLAKTGIEYQFSKKWYGQIEGYYRGSWNENVDLIPNITGINTRLFYKF